MASAKAAWDNFMNGSGDADQLADAFATAADNIVKNLAEIIPRFAETLPALGGAIIAQIPGLVAAIVPAVLSAGQSVLKGGLVRAHGRAVVVLPRYGNVPGGRIGHGIADVEADEFRSPVRNPLGHPASVHAGDVAAHRVDLQDSSAGFQQNIRGLLLIL